MAPELSIILPCLNEEKSLGYSIDKLNNIIKKNQYNAEIIVVDNGSTDNSQNIAKEKQVNLIFEPKRGYGNAYLAGIKNTNGEKIIMVDPDGSYELNELPRFVEELNQNDFVIGNRFNNQMEKGAMHFLNRQGNKLIRLLLNLNGFKAKEVCTGFVGIKKEKLNQLDLKSPGMEFSSEFLINVSKNKLNMAEIDIKFNKRIGQAKLRRFRDGFRHLRFLLSEKLK